MFMSPRQEYDHHHA